jgi:pyruvate ferredoxin oxidoreductase gamma subunit
VYRIRLHGRGGQGMKTASRILGTAFFREGFEVQDAPLYGAERRGAPIFAYVRAARRAIHERGSIARPDLVVVGDESLVSVAASAVLAGVHDETVLLFQSGESPGVWRERLRCPGPVLTFGGQASDAAELRFVGASCAGAAARLVGVIGRDALEQSIHQEVAGMPAEALETSLERAFAGWDAMQPHAGSVHEGDDLPPEDVEPPRWVELPFETAELSAPDIHGALTSVQVRTGLWRTTRPVIDYEHCTRCSWICSTFCPDGAIGVEPDRTPVIDYEHCKGCLVCVAVCPPHAIGTVPESEAGAAQGAGAETGS